MRVEAMKADTQFPEISLGPHSTYAAQPVDFDLKETRPHLARIHRRDKRDSAYAFVERMDLLYVSVVKARDLPIVDIPGSLDPFVEVTVGNYRGVTKHTNMSQDPDWNVVFAFSKDQMQASVLLEVAVKYKVLIKDVCIVRFVLNEVPVRVPPDSPLAPQWYPLEDNMGERIEGELMLAVWNGTQADEAFYDAWHVDAATCRQLRPKIYHAPKLWYVRVNVIEAQDLEPADRTCFPEVSVKARIGNQVLRTKDPQTRTLSPFWNEDLLFVVSELCVGHLVLTVENRLSPAKEEDLGIVSIPLSRFDRRADDQPTPARWYNLTKPIASGVDQLNNEDFSSKLRMRLCVDEGYHVLDDSEHCSRAKQLCKTPIGVLKLGIVNAEHIVPMKTRDGRETSDTYCVAKYGMKWVRTRIVVDSLCPKFNEDYTWEVFDKGTVLTVGVFVDFRFRARGSNGDKDIGIGKIAIPVSNLESDRIYTCSYPLLHVFPSGVKRMGELLLGIRFTCTSTAKMLYQYSRPLLPKMHYVQPIHIREKDWLRHHAVRIVSAHFARAEPALCSEVVDYMYEVSGSGGLWSMRKSKANLFRLMTVPSGVVAVGKWFGVACSWKNPITTLVAHILFLMLVCFPVLILPIIFLYMFLIVVWNYRYRPRYPPQKDIRISYVDNCHLDELDEEFDTFPTSRSPDLVRMRYDRLRSIAGRLQTVAGDVATQGERLLALLSWREPCATAIFGVFCLVAAVVLYVTPFQVVVALAGLYMMRHPRFRSPLPAAPINFFCRLPDRTETML